MRKIRTPCEIIMWDIVPAIRKELAYVLVKDYGFSQKEVAYLLGVSEAAVSQYMKKKRGNKTKLDKKDMEKIKEIAKKIATKQTESAVIKSICEICKVVYFKKIKNRCSI
ncbi:MAG TPA: transcriptional regulator [Nanoarchaeota archaeon]|nr:transcriptional regulator [Nanoarchaeota archaeon]